MRVEYRISAYQYIPARTGLQALFAAAAFHAYTVVAAVHEAAAYQHATAVAYVYAVTVLRIPGAGHLEILEYHVLALRRVDVEFRGIPHRHPLYPDALAAFEYDHVVAYGFLFLGRAGEVGETLEIVREPEFAVLAYASAHFQQPVPLFALVFVPFGISPPLAVAVQDSVSCDAYVFAFFRPDAGECTAFDNGSALRVLREVCALVIGEEQGGTRLQVEVYAAFQLYGPGHPGAGSDYQTAAAHLLEHGYGLCDRVAAVTALHFLPGLAAQGSGTLDEVTQIQFFGRDIRLLRLLHFDGQIPVEFFV